MADLWPAQTIPLAPGPGRTQRAIGVSADGRILQVVGGGEAVHEGRSWGVRDAGRLGRGLALNVWEGDHQTTLPLPGLPFDPCHVQECPEGFVIGATWSDRDDAPNAAIVSRVGKIVRLLWIGNAVQDLRTADGQIVVSYFDEAMSANPGWGDPGQAHIGTRLLNALDARGHLTWAYDADAAGTEDIVDAYALNVTPDGAVWTSFYTDFPIVRFLDGHYTTWSGVPEPVHALVVARECVYALHDRGDGGELREYGLRAPGRVTPGRSWRLRDRDGAPLAADRERRWLGVGDALYAACRGSVLVFRPAATGGTP